jgi:hypothetical protein
MLPNFFIAGVSRSGTTSLYHYMSQHPLIDFPELKEPRYFSHGSVVLPQKGPGDYTVDQKLVATWDDYCAIYEGLENTFIGDASSEYLYNYKSVIPETLKRLGDIPIILMLRNPVDRSYSAYNNLVRDGRETLPFEQALEKEEERKEANFDEMWHYTSVSKYSKSVDAFKANFSKVKVLIFEEFIENPEKYVAEIFDFMGAPQLERVNTAITYSKSGKPKSKLITLLFGRNSSLGNTIRNIVFSILGRTNVEKLGKHFMSENKELSKDIRIRLFEYFASDIEELEKVLGRDLNLWKID